MACWTRLPVPNGRVKWRPMDEFALIDALVEILGDNVRGPGILLGPGDDASLVEPPAGSLTASSIDTLVAGVHFPSAAPADLVGYRAMGVSVSDLAAMGAVPAYALIAVTLPEGSDRWLERFAHGVAAAASRFAIKIVGGNLARGPLNVSVSVHGYVGRGEALTRSGARPGDLVCVSGALGGAAAALSRADLESPPPMQALLALQPHDVRYPLRRYYAPEPRVALGRALRGLASATIDVSDGLVADLGHVCAASGVAGVIDLALVPVVSGVSAPLAATGGDDYELCFTIAPGDVPRLGALPTAATVVGRIEPGDGVSVISDGREVQLERGGFSHFR
jgi:thiamine-monophosphate kinase